MELLKPGDRVIVIAGDPCCGNPEHVGMIFTIEDICPGIDVRCHICEAGFDDLIAWVPGYNVGEHQLGFLLECLQLIRPDAEIKKIEQPVTVPELEHQ